MYGLEDSTVWDNDSSSSESNNNADLQNISTKSNLNNFDQNNDNQQNTFLNKSTMVYYLNTYKQLFISFLSFT